MLGVDVAEAVDVTVRVSVFVTVPDMDAVLLGVLELEAVLDPVLEGVFVLLAVLVSVLGGVPAAVCVLVGVIV